MAKFEIAFELREPIEGGYSNEPEDSGNWSSGVEGKGELLGTNRGVCCYEYAKLLGRNPTIEEMKNMPREKAMQHFQNEVWAKMRGDEILNQEIANSIYDSCVNMGVGTGIKLAQRSAGLPETGKMDDTTLHYLNNQ